MPDRDTDAFIGRSFISRGHHITHGRNGSAPPDNLSRWPEFARAVAARLDAGRATYGDKSFSRHPAVLCGEVEQELLDVCGWAYVLWVRMRDLRAALDGSAQTMAAGPSDPLATGGI